MKRKPIAKPKEKKKFKIVRKTLIILLCLFVLALFLLAMLLRHIRIEDK
jgi:hypothetical protein